MKELLQRSTAGREMRLLPAVASSDEYLDLIWELSGGAPRLVEYAINCLFQQVNDLPATPSERLKKDLITAMLYAFGYYGFPEDVIINRLALSAVIFQAMMRTPIGWNTPVYGGSPTLADVARVLPMHLAAVDGSKDCFRIVFPGVWFKTPTPSILTHVAGFWKKIVDKGRSCEAMTCNVLNMAFHVVGSCGHATLDQVLPFLAGTDVGRQVALAAGQKLQFFSEPKRVSQSNAMDLLGAAMLNVPFLMHFEPLSSFADLLLVTQERRGAPKTVITFQLKNVDSDDLTHGEVEKEAAKVLPLLKLLEKEQAVKEVKHRHLFVVMAKCISGSVRKGKVFQVAVKDTVVNECDVVDKTWRTDVLVVDHVAVLGEELAQQLADATTQQR